MPLNLPANAKPDDEENKAPALQIPGNAAPDTGTRQPTFAEKAAAFAQGGGRGLTDALPITGAAAGTLLAAPGGPGAALAGGTLGAGAGTAAKGALDDFLNIPTVEEMPEELRPFGFAGQAFGGSLPLIGTPLAAGKFGVETGMRFLDRVLHTAATRPKAFTAAELSATTGGAIGEGVAESAAPGETGVRIGAGVAGSVLAPGGLLLSATDLVREGYRKAAQTFSQGGRESAAASEILAAIAADNGDPKALADAILNAKRLLPQGATPTAGQLTGNKTLIALEAELARRSSAFGREAQQQGSQALTALRTAADALTATGDPNALKEAAVLRDKYFETLLTDMVSDAEQQAVTFAQRIGPTTDESTSAISTRASALLDTALSNARAKEKELYRAVPNSKAGVDSILRAADDVRANDLATAGGEPIEGLPPLANRFETAMRGFIEEGNDTPSSVHELMRFRSRMLEEARSASAAGDFVGARVFGKLAAGAFDDLSAVADPALDTARAFSRELNDVFTRSFAGTAERTAGTGARRIPPEAMLRRATGTGLEAGAVRVRELQRAVEFGSPEAGAEFLAMQEQFIRSAAENLVDPGTGLVNANQLARFRRRHAETLKEFPELAEQLSGTENAARFLKGAQDTAKGARRAIDSRAAFARVAQTENPVVAVSRSLSGPRPVEDFRQLAILARRDGPDAAEGLQRSVVDDAFQRAGFGTEQFSFEKAHDMLFSARRAGQPSSIDLMLKNGIMDAETAERLETLLRQGQSITTAMRSGNAQLDDLLTGASGLFDLAVRITGARAGSAAANLGGPGGGHSLIAASAGSRFARQVLEKIPVNQVQDVLIEAAKNPDFMRALLLKGGSAKERIRIGQKLNAYLVSLGFVEAPRELENGNEP